MAPFSLADSINSASSWAYNAPIIGGIVNNPVLTALLLCAFMAVIALALYGPQIRAAGPKRGVRALLYAFLATLSVTFVHHYAIQFTSRKAASEQGVRDIFNSISVSRDMGTPAAPPSLGAGEARAPVPEPDPVADILAAMEPVL